MLRTALIIISLETLVKGPALRLTKTRPPVGREVSWRCHTRISGDRAGRSIG
jgi:hypothetical protein